jgi:hypothetical protein
VGNSPTVDNPKRKIIKSTNALDHNDDGKYPGHFIEDAGQQKDTNHGQRRP